MGNYLENRVECVGNLRGIREESFGKSWGARGGLVGNSCGRITLEIVGPSRGNLGGNHLGYRGELVGKSCFVLEIRGEFVWKS